MEATAALLKQTSSDGQIITVLPPPKDIDGNFGKDVVGAAVTFDETLAPAIWADFLPQALERGKFVPKPDPMIVGKGLGHIQKGLDAQRKGVSARKVVVVLD